MITIFTHCHGVTEQANKFDRAMMVIAVTMLAMFRRKRWI